MHEKQYSQGHHSARGYTSPLGKGLYSRHANLRRGRALQNSLYWERSIKSSGTWYKSLVYPIVACALSGVVVCGTSLFVALCFRPTYRLGIPDRDKLKVSYLLPIFLYERFFYCAKRGARRLESQTTTEIRISRHLLETVPAGVEETGRRLESQTTTEIRISRHLLETVPAGVEETGRRLSSPGHGQRSKYKSLVYPTVACALSGVVVCGTSLFVALCFRPTYRLGIPDRDKLKVSYLLPIFLYERFFYCAKRGARRLESQTTTEIRISRHLLETVPAGVEETGRRLESQTTTEIRISRHLLETVPAGVEETGRRLSSPGHGQRSKYKSLVYPTVACALSGVVVCGTSLFVALCFRPTYRLGIPDRDKLKVSYLLPIFLYERFFYCAKRGARRLESQTTTEIRISRHLLETVPAGVEEKGRRLESQTTTEIRISRHLLETVPAGVEETGRRLSSPGHGQRSKYKSLVYPTVACALSGVVVCGTSLFVALCFRPTYRLGIPDRDKLKVSYLLPIFLYERFFYCAKRGARRLESQTTTEIRISRHLLETVPAGVEETGRRLESQTTTEIRISRHLLETVPAGVEETGRRLSSPGHGQRSKYKSLVYPTVACALSGVVVCGTSLFVALCFRPTYRLGIPDRDKLKVSYLLPIFLYERFFYCAKRGARRLESQTTTEIRISRHLLETVPAGVEETGRRLESQTTTEIRISRHLLETVPAGVEETGRRLSSPGHGQRSKYKSLVYPTVACALSGVVVCGTSLFVALCFRPTYRLGIPDRDKLKVSYLLPIFLYERFFYCAKRGARRLESQTTTEIRISRHLLETVPAGVEETGRRLESQTTTEIRISRHLLETVPAGVEETGRRLSSPGHGQRSKYKSLVYPTVACALSGVVVCGTSLFVALCFRPTYRLGIPDRDKLKVSYLLPIFLYERFFYCAKRGARRLESQTTTEIRISRHLLETVPAGVEETGRRLESQTTTEIRISRHLLETVPAGVEETGRRLSSPGHGQRSKYKSLVYPTVACALSGVVVCGTSLFVALCFRPTYRLGIPDRDKLKVSYLLPIFLYERFFYCAKRGARRLESQTTTEIRISRHLLETVPAGVEETGRRLESQTTTEIRISRHLLETVPAGVEETGRRLSSPGHGQRSKYKSLVYPTVACALSGVVVCGTSLFVALCFRPTYRLGIPDRDKLKVSYLLPIFLYERFFYCAKRGARRLESQTTTEIRISRHLLETVPAGVEETGRRLESQTTTEIRISRHLLETVPAGVEETGRRLSSPGHGQRSKYKSLVYPTVACALSGVVVCGTSLFVALCFRPTYRLGIPDRDKLKVSYLLPIFLYERFFYCAKRGARRLESQTTTEIRISRHLLETVPAGVEETGRRLESQTTTEIRISRHLLETVPAGVEETGRRLSSPGHGQRSKYKSLVYPTVACALSGVVVCGTSLFVALCFRPTYRLGIPDRDKLKVSYLLPIFLYERFFYCAKRGARRLESQTTTEIRISRHLLETVPAGVEETGRRLESQTTTEIRISRHLLETVPAGVEETGRRLSSPGHGQRSKYKSLVYPTVACALSGVVVCGTSLFVALCFRPTYRLGIPDRDKLKVSYLLPIFLYERFFYCAKRGARRLESQTTTEIRISRHLLETVPAGVEETGRRLESQTTTEIRISRHLLETVPAGVEETGRRLSSPGHGQRSKYKSLVYPTVACALSGVVVCGTSLFVALCFRPTYRLGIPDRDKLKVSYLLPIFLYERFFYCAKRGARRLESQTTTEIRISRHLLETVPAGVEETGRRLESQTTTEIRISRHLLETVPAGVEETGRRLESQTTTEIRISRHLLETVPAGVEETGRRLSSPGHGQRSKYKSLVYPTVACALSGVVVCGTFLFVALCFRPTYRLGIPDRDKLKVSYLLPIFLYERFFYCAKRGARRLESQTLQLKFGLADIYSKLSRRVWRKREEDFRAQATAKEVSIRA